jgi:hypothetical protein
MSESESKSKGGDFCALAVWVDDKHILIWNVLAVRSTLLLLCCFVLLLDHVLHVGAASEVRCLDRPPARILLLRMDGTTMVGNDLDELDVQVL